MSVRNKRKSAVRGRMRRTDTLLDIRFSPNRCSLNTKQTSHKLVNAS